MNERQVTTLSGLSAENGMLVQLCYVTFQSPIEGKTKMTPSQQNVLDAFDSFNDQVVHNQALQAELLQKGFNTTAIVDAINSVIENGVLSSNDLGEISRTTN